MATWIFAPLKLQADMGTVLSFMFLVNMVGAIALLPALGAFLMRTGKAREERASGGVGGLLKKSSLVGMTNKTESHP